MRVLLGGCVPVGDGALPYAPGHTVNDLHTLPKLSPDEPLGHPRRDTARTPPTGTDESKTAIATSGWATRLRECLASGDETQ
jgi:hypothetical protein